MRKTCCSKATRNNPAIFHHPVADILLIETSTIVCSAGLLSNGEIIALRESNDKNSHAGQITVFIDEVMKMCGKTYSQLDAVSVSMGPGSYTGLRIGVSTAKGICYALDKPLIAVNTLQAMAAGFVSKYGASLNGNDLLCPLIDARRMEVYQALFDRELHTVQETEAVVIDSDSFKDMLQQQRLWFFGDGAEKCKSVLCAHPNAVFVDDFVPSAAFLAPMTNTAWQKSQFENTAYFEPFYLKDFVAALPKVKGLR